MQALVAHSIKPSTPAKSIGIASYYDLLLLLIGIAMLFLIVFLLIPLINVFVQAFAKGFSGYISALRDPDQVQ